MIHSLQLVLVLKIRQKNHNNLNLQMLSRIQSLRTLLQRKRELLEMNHV